MSSSTPTRTKKQSAIADEIRRQATTLLGRRFEACDIDDRFRAVALAARERLLPLLIETDERVAEARAKRLYYLSMEFLVGRALDNNLVNLGLRDSFREALSGLDTRLEDVLAVERDAALGNGGLGRLAACFLDSLATLDLPGSGYGINYEFGLFRQQIQDGEQRELPDEWRAFGTPWQVERPSEAVLVPLYGRIEHGMDREGAYNPMWLDWRLVVGVPYDMPIVGYGGRTVNALRLFAARASTDFDMRIFNDGDYFKAVEQKISSETISKVLYPSDSKEAGRELRLVQEYFLVACALRDMLRRLDREGGSLNKLPERVAVQLNDTHPALAVAELMRLLVDENELSWERAWDITRRTLAYTNHTVLPEALEKWPEPLLAHVLPRHLQVIHEINRRFLDEVSTRHPNDYDRLRRMSIIEEGEVKNVRMVNLAVVGSHAVNGVAALHTEILKRDLLGDFHEMWPERFSNKTNGVTPRRWMLAANPELASLVTETIGSDWVRDASRLVALEPHLADAAFLERFAAVKRANKVRLAADIERVTRERVDPDALFDVHVKRIHLYKRQLLNLLHIAHRFLEIKAGREPKAPRVWVFAGKAAPGYWAAKQVIKLAHAMADLVNRDPDAKRFMRVAFLPDYSVSLAERIVPAADLSEQISTAGMEASGTGNMKLALNGAVTIGTMDGANVEIHEAVGDENIFIFGLSSDQVAALKRSPDYHPADRYENDALVRGAVDLICGPSLGARSGSPFAWILPALVFERDPYCHLMDLRSYAEAQDRADIAYADRLAWARMAALNTARNGRFSSDRTILEYAAEIWNLCAV